MAEQCQIVQDNKENSLYDGVEPLWVCLADVESKELKWLWPNRIPMGKLSLLVGDPDLGKSLLTIYMTSIVTNGGKWPDISDESTENEKGSVILLTAEDDLEDTVKPRMEAAEADISKVVVMKGVEKSKDEKNQTYFNLTGGQNLAALHKLIIQRGDVRLVVLDPITAYLGKIDSHKTSDVRGILAPLCDLAFKTGVAIIGISHHNKNASLKAIYRTTGSVAFVAAARAVWQVYRDKSDKDRRLLVPCKANLSHDPTSMAFRLISAPANGGKLSSVVCAFEPDTFYMSADEAQSKESPDKRTEKPAPKRDRAVEWLEGKLKDGSVRKTEIADMAKVEKITPSTLKKAKEALRVRSDKVGAGEGQYWLWRLPTEEERMHDLIEEAQPAFEEAKISPEVMQQLSKSTGSS